MQVFKIPHECCNAIALQHVEAPFKVFELCITAEVAFIW